MKKSYLGKSSERIPKKISQYVDIPFFRTNVQYLDLNDFIDNSTHMKFFKFIPKFVNEGI